MAFNTCSIRVCNCSRVCRAVSSWTVTPRAGWRSTPPQARSPPETSWTEKPWRLSKSLLLCLRRVREQRQITVHKVHTDFTFHQALINQQREVQHGCLPLKETQRCLPSGSCRWGCWTWTTTFPSWRRPRPSSAWRNPSLWSSGPKTETAPPSPSPSPSSWGIAISRLTGNCWALMVRRPTRRVAVCLRGWRQVEVLLRFLRSSGLLTDTTAKLTLKKTPTEDKTFSLPIKVLDNAGMGVTHPFEGGSGRYLGWKTNNYLLSTSIVFVTFVIGFSTGISLEPEVCIDPLLNLMFNTVLMVGQPGHLSSSSFPQPLGL